MRENAKLALPFVFGRIGRWWGNNQDKKRQEEIDILAVDDENALFGECKRRNEPVGISVINELMGKGELFKQYKNKHYRVFSKSGFTQDMEEAAVNMENVQLVDLKGMFVE